MLTLLLCLSIEAYASDAAYRKLEADKHVTGLLSMLQARRQHSGIHGLRYCARLSADCKENNRLQRQLGAGYCSAHLSYFFTHSRGLPPASHLLPLRELHER